MLPLSIPSVVAGFVVLMALAFIIWYVWPSIRLWRTLKSVIPSVQALKPIAGSGPTNLQQVAEILSTDRTLAHLWSKYTETLHEQYDYVEGERRLVAIRATVPAEVFFNSQVLVDTPLNTEFFRHLPGILTGVGIIGTFSGLIHGLSEFKATGSAEVVKTSLDGLMAGVKDAFYASAGAIFAAMLITFLEKIALNRCYKRIEQLCHAIDTLYEAGAGEEYLARLVKATEENATHTAQLKQSLVDDLKQILTDLTERQIQASQQHSQQMATDVGNAIQASLQTPLQQIAEVVERASGQQGTAVHNMLQDLLAAFMAKIDETVGGQMRGLNDMISKSVNSMQEMQAEFGKLVNDLRQVGQSNAEELSTRLTEMFAKAEARQSALVTRMGDFLAEIRNALGETQTSTRQQMEETLQVVHVQLQGMVQVLEEQRVIAAKSEAERHNQLATATVSMVDSVKGEVEDLVSEVAKAIAAMERNIASLQTVSTSAIDRMNSGAETMYLAAGEFSKAGDTVSQAANVAADALDELENVTQPMLDATKNLAAVSNALEGVQYKIREMIGSLEMIVAEAKRDAQANSKMISDLKEAAISLSEAEVQAGIYLREVNEVLGKAFADFGDGVKSGLKASNAAFHEEMSRGVNLINAALQEFSALISQSQSKR